MFMRSKQSHTSMGRLHPRPAQRCIMTKSNPKNLFFTIAFFQVKMFFTIATLLLNKLKFMLLKKLENIMSNGFAFWTSTTAGSASIYQNNQFHLSFFLYFRPFVQNYAKYPSSHHQPVKNIIILSVTSKIRTLNPWNEVKMIKFNLSNYLVRIILVDNKSSIEFY